MEPSKMFGGAEECHSSESGWTMYIGSPIRDYDDDDGSGTDADTDAADDGVGDDDSDANDDDDDDSMASDASSGPSHEMARLKHGDDDDDDNDGKSCIEKKTNKSMDKELEGRKKKSPRKEDEGDMTGSSKVRKSLWQSKKK